MTLKQCPQCDGDLYPHCDTSPACDWVQCEDCRASGSLDGRWWAQSRAFYQFMNAVKRAMKPFDQDKELP